MWKPKAENWKSNSNGGTTNQNQNQSVQRCFPHGELWVGHIFDTYHLMILRFYDTYIIGEVENISRRHRRHWVIYELSSGNKLGQFRADSLGNLPLPPPPIPLQLFFASKRLSDLLPRSGVSWKPFAASAYKSALKSAPLYSFFPSHSLALRLCAVIQSTIGSVALWMNSFVCLRLVSRNNQSQSLSLSRCLSLSPAVRGHLALSLLLLLLLLLMHFVVVWVFMLRQQRAKKFNSQNAKTTTRRRGRCSRRRRKQKTNNSGNGIWKLHNIDMDMVKAQEAAEEKEETD